FPPDCRTTGDRIGFVARRLPAIWEVEAATDVAALPFERRALDPFWNLWPHRLRQAPRLGQVVAGRRHSSRSDDSSDRERGFDGTDCQLAGSICRSGCRPRIKSVADHLVRHFAPMRGRGPERIIARTGAGGGVEKRYYVEH